MKSEESRVHCDESPSLYAADVLLCCGGDCASLLQVRSHLGRPCAERWSGLQVTESNEMHGAMRLHVEEMDDEAEHPIAAPEAAFLTIPRATCDESLP